MPSDYEAITKYNVRQLGEDTSTRKTQVCMYSDSTHFVYELLQNADDYGATEVVFKLTPEGLTVEHNGKPFTEKNVQAVTYFGKSTSREDLVKTGRFGVGFKSVFAFTATPVIISGQEHFKIHGLYRVCEHPYPDNFSRTRTRIIMPFNHEVEHPDYVEDQISAKEAYSKISARLTGLNMHTLLFTRNIREIRWEIEGSSGHYFREDAPKEESRQTTITDGKTLRKYLVFSRIPSWHGQAFKDVEIAFGLDEKGQIIAIQDCLYVLFATTQETHLNFVLNGPYRTNPSRETIAEDDVFNCHLMKETCELLTTILPCLRDRGMLTTQFLGVLPNETDKKIRPFYSSLLDTVIERFQKEALVPTDEGKYAVSSDVFQGPAPLREVITPLEFSFLAELKRASWAKGVVQNTRPDQFLKSLKIAQWGWAELQQAFSSKYGGYCANSSSDVEWLEKRSDDWLQKLYILLGDALTRGDCHEWSLQHCRIIRVLENKDVTHVSGIKAYFPKGKSYRDLPQIKPSILRGKAKQRDKKIEESLVALGVREIGDEERIDLMLETYYGEGSDPVTRQQHLDHMRSFIKWWKKEHDALKFRGQAIFRIAGNEEMKDPESCYLDAPLQTTGLQAIYKEPRKGIAAKHKLWTGYKELLSGDFCNFSVACGATVDLPIEEWRCDRHSKSRDLRQDYKCGAKYTNSGIDDDYMIAGLKSLLELKNIEICRLVWDTVRKAKPEVLEARFRPNRQYETRTEKSSLVLMLAKFAWIPDNRGTFHTPAEIDRNSLHASFSFDDRNGWLTAIGFGENAKKATAEYQIKEESAKNLGLDMETVDLLSDLSLEEQAEFKADLRRRKHVKTQARNNQQEFISFHEALLETFGQGGGEQTLGSPQPAGVSRNPESRRVKLAEDISGDIENEPSPEARFTLGLSKKWNGKNDTVRMKLQHWYEGRCQICDETFLKRDGAPYFEGLYLVPYTKAEWIDRPGNVLCLCPLHSAMFQFGSKQVDADIISDVLTFVPKASGGSGEASINLTLCGKTKTIKFHEDHFLELQVMIQESNKLNSDISKQTGNKLPAG